MAKSAFTDRHDDRLRSAVADVISTESGMLVLGRVLAECRMHDEIFTPGAADATAYGCGRRAVGLAIQRMLDIVGSSGYECEAAWERHKALRRAQAEPKDT